MFHHIRGVFENSVGENHHTKAALVTHNKDRKSTRLNSSHLVISYAVFCLKKKTKCPPVLAQAPSCVPPHALAHAPSPVPAPSPHPSHSYLRTTTPSTSPPAVADTVSPLPD